MALGAAHIFVPSGQRELRSLIVIESRRRPAHGRVAVIARGHAVLGGKLRAMYVSMAGVAILRRSLELNVMRAGERLVAVAAGDHAMPADQIAFRLRVIESLNVDPGAHIVAGLASHRRAIGAEGGH